MEQKLLNNFHNDTHTRDAVKEFLFEYLNKVALERVFSKESTEGIADAKEIIEEAFIELKELFDIEKKVAVNSSR